MLPISRGCMGVLISALNKKIDIVNIDSVMV